LLSLLHSVAGTIAAKHNDIGVVGVAPDAIVIPVKVLYKNGSGPYSAIIAGVNYVGANGKAGNVANMSLGGGVSTALDSAVIAAAANMGIYFTLSAGNSGQDASNYSPARANGLNIFTISAIDNTDTLASFSNYGSPVDYAAPGASVYSTYKNGGYTTYSGTSIAAPHAAGVLLVTNGQPNTCGTVIGDRDTTVDPIICL
jgi:subtilisin family serine protease